VQRLKGKKVLKVENSLFHRTHKMKATIYGVNFILIFLIARFEYNSSSDKTIIISSLGFLVLLLLNIMFGFFAQIENKTIYKHYYYSAVAMVIAAFILLAVW
jgi:hypothetical protein